MSTETLTPPSPEALPERHESLFPIGLEEILPIRNRLLKLTPDDIRSFVDVRRDGRSNDPVTIIYGSGFAEWHQERGDFASEQALRMYRGGKLYGAQIALDRYKHLHDGQPLVADDPIAYAAAKHRVRTSYEDLGDVTQWEADFQREQRHLHGGMLALLNAGLHDHTLRLYHQMYRGTVPKTEALESFYTGLIDASIFINTYASLRDTGQLPPLAEKTDREWGRDLPDIYFAAQAAVDQAHGVRLAFELESRDSDFSDLVDRMRIRDLHSERVLFPSPDGRGERIVAYTRVIEQAGPNEFVYTHEPRGIYEISSTPMAYRVKWAGRYALGGVFAGNLADLWLPSTSLAQAAVAGGLGAVIGAATGFARQTPHTDRVLNPIWVAPGYEQDSQYLDITLQK